jgi:hypothetical protein
LPFLKQHLEVLKASTADSGSWGRAQAPARWAQALPPHELPEAIASYNRPLSREELREVCRDPAVDVLTAYLCIMAWGGQRRDHGRMAWSHRSRIQRQGAAFNVFAAEDPIQGLAVAFFTKLIFFFRKPASGYFILDQWTGNSMNLLCGYEVVPLDPSWTVSRRTTAAAYDKYCELIVELSKQLCVSPDQTEQLLLSEGGRAPKPWRRHVLQERHAKSKRGRRNSYPKTEMNDS